MKLSATFYVVITTLLLVAVGVLVYYDFSYRAVWYTVVIGQAWWIFTVYKIITDDYSTEKTFDDWYEDKPITNE